MRYRDRPQAEFRAVRPDERRHAIDWLPCRRIARDRRPAGVVAVEAEPRVRVQLGAAERPDHEAALGTHQTGAGNAAVRRVARGHTETVAIYSNARQRSIRATSREPFSERGSLARNLDSPARLDAEATNNFNEGKPC